MDLAKSIHRALIGEVPPTLRFIYARLEHCVLHFHAVFTDDATDDHLECASVVLTEVLADCESEVQLQEKIERNGSLPWRQGNGEHLHFLRYGEFSDT